MGDTYVKCLLISIGMFSVSRATGSFVRDIDYQFTECRNSIEFDQL